MSVESAEIGVEKPADVRQPFGVLTEWYKAQELAGDLRSYSVIPENIAIATTTFYSGFASGSINEKQNRDTVRGRLALKTVEACLVRGYNLVVVDGGSSDDFLTEVTRLRKKYLDSYVGEFRFLDQKESGMGASRREAIGELMDVGSAKVGVWTEPEKHDFVEFGLLVAALPIIKGEADLVVPKRRAFVNYPQQQAEQETLANEAWTESLIARGYMGDEECQDAWIGPRVFRLDGSVTDLFLRKLELDNKIAETDELAQKYLDSWAASIFIPLIAAYEEGLRVENVEIDYQHPISQKAVEDGVGDYEDKRVIQRESILRVQIYYMDGKVKRAA